ncbi:hypothetical protein NA56DRAFT_661351 [Hyaloscypha hepaticicola]|uniref:Uncharacterized protein n=1 Tax=Hyaloscypha hepaticicola TaxID=2082293 RepID=A0A2J6PWM5_9HELO|nr:hypothetical protein NA56DRAFT_661351 [Hyaloscypha hepaticicola]
MKLSIFAFLLPLAPVSASVLSNGAVANNNCGRAVAGTAKGSAFMSSARNDCSSNVISTTTVLVTPAASHVGFQPLKNTTKRHRTFISAVTDFATLQSTNIVESTISTTILMSTETTEVESQTFTDYSTSIATVTSTFYATTTPYVLASTDITLSLPSTVTSYTPIVPGPSTTAPAKRDLAERATSASPTIPAYASACKSFSDYAQACSAA